jgi:putative DNA methylase
MTTLTPFALQHTPALIESVFPGQKISFESQRKRKAGAGRTLTALGSLERPQAADSGADDCAGSLLPLTSNGEKDMEIYEQLLAFNMDGLTGRALANAENLGNGA